MGLALGLPKQVVGFDVDKCRLEQQPRLVGTGCSSILQTEWFEVRSAIEAVVAARSPDRRQTALPVPSPQRLG
jgi:hypothetical protein